MCLDVLFKFNLLGIPWGLSLCRFVLFLKIISSSQCVLFFLSFWGSPVSQMFDLSVGNSKSLKGQSYRLDLYASYFLFLYFLTIFFGFCLTRYSKEICVIFQTSIKCTLLTIIFTSKHLSFFVLPLFVLFSFLSILVWLCGCNISLSGSTFLWSFLYYLCFSLCLVFNYFVFLVAGFLKMPGAV